ncbi:hypothetical protein JCM11251_004786 [Rhodosporidiobolus azoricus]
MPSSSRKTASKSPLKAPPKAGSGKKGGGLNKYKFLDCFGEDGTIYCFCDADSRLEAALRTTRNGREENYGRQFWGCDNPVDKCNFFLWANESESYGGPPPPDPDEEGEHNFLSSGRTLGSSQKAKAKNSTASAKKTPTKKRGRAHDLSDCEDEVYGEWEDAKGLFRRTPSPPLRTGKRLHDNPSSSSASPTKRARASARSPSPDWPDPEELQSKIAEQAREILRLKRQVKEAERVAERAKKEAEEVKEENMGMLKKLYPDIFPSTQLVE